MKNNSLDEIIKHKVDISQPPSNDATFDTILLVVPSPKDEGEKTMDKVTAISKADELINYGYTTEESAYIAATVAFSQSPAPDKLLVVIRKTDGEGFEEIATTLDRAKNEAEFYGIHITEFKDENDVVAAVSWAEANEKLFAFEYDSIDSCPVKNFSFYRSFGIFAGKAEGYEAEEQPEENKYAALAWMARCFGYDPGTETWNLKELAGIVPSVLSTDEKNALKETNINSFLRYAGCNCTIGGFTLAGEWIDVIRFRDWLKAEMQNRVFSVIKVNRKVPFTDNGIGLIEGAMEATLKEGQDIGGIAQTEYDSEDRVIPGFEVYVPNASDIAEEERKSRTLTGCRYKARLAGAIHLVEIEGFLTF